MLAMIRTRSPRMRRSLRHDGVAGVVLGVESVPDGLAGGLLAGVNPVYGLYAYLVGTFTGALTTSSSFMAVQATGAMAILIADVDAIDHADDPARALFTLSITTGVLMILAGALRLGSVLRFVSNAVMVGFVNAVGVNIVLGQLSNFTGYQGQGDNRVVRALDTLLHPGRLDTGTFLIGAATIALIIALERTRFGHLGMVVAVAATSAAVAALGWDEIAQLRDLAEVPRSLPSPMLPDLDLVLPLVVPAFSLAFVGLVQGASISANFPNPDSTYPDASRDFIGQGAANVACGVFQGMPVGGSMSATSLVKSAGARTRQALVIAAIVMAVVIVVFGAVVSAIALPALAGLLMVVGCRTIKPHDLRSVAKTGKFQAAVLVVTFALTLLIPLQYAVIVGVGLSVILHVISQSNQVDLKQRIYHDNGAVRETDPPEVVPPDTVLVLQPYGSLFFASAPTFEAALPAVEPTSRNSVVILRLRGRSDLGGTFMDVLRRYAQSLSAVASKLVIVSANEQVIEQLATTRVLDVVRPDDVYPADEWVGRTVRRAHDDALQWIDTNRRT
jgi:SulP family sulfate permease